jgi:hypothetical protein
LEVDLAGARDGREQDGAAGLGVGEKMQREQGADGEPRGSDKGVCGRE